MKAHYKVKQNFIYSVEVLVLLAFHFIIILQKKTNKINYEKFNAAVCMSGMQFFNGKCPTQLASL
jgi:hypothetical protein